MSIAQRIALFCERFGARLPILLAPMAGASAPALSIAVANAGGIGACGALLMTPEEIAAWVAAVRAGTSGPIQLNLWIPDPPPVRDPAREAQVRSFLAGWGPAVPPDAGDAVPPDFDAQCEALLDARPAIVSSVMGVFPPAFVARAQARGIAWFAIASTVAEARIAAFPPAPTPSLRRAWKPAVIAPRSPEWTPSSSSSACSLLFRRWSTQSASR